jgi:phosphotriesterase-related protein
MSFIRTVLGDLAPEKLGACYAHEHVIIDRSYTTQLFPDIHLPSVENAVKELADFKAAGGGAMVDCMPCDAGRNVEKLAEISRQSGVHLIAPTGLHRARFYPEGHWRFSSGPERLADLFVEEIERGIDANDAPGSTSAAPPPRGGSRSQRRRPPRRRRADLVFEAVAPPTAGPAARDHHCSRRGAEQVAFLRARGRAPPPVLPTPTAISPRYHCELLLDRRSPSSTTALPREARRLN